MLGVLEQQQGLEGMSEENGKPGQGDENREVTGQSLQGLVGHGEDFYFCPK